MDFFSTPAQDCLSEEWRALMKTACQFSDQLLALTLQSWHCIYIVMAFGASSKKPQVSTLMLQLGQRDRILSAVISKTEIVASNILSYSNSVFSTFFWPTLQRERLCTIRWLLYMCAFNKKLFIHALAVHLHNIIWKQVSIRVLICEFVESLCKRQNPILWRPI